jgi:F-type H+-transporting ATPase subunit b
MKLRTERLWTASLLSAVWFLALPGLALASESGGGRSELWLGIGKLTNLILVIAVLVWVGRKPLAAFFAGRTEAIREQLAEAQRARAEAETKLAEIEASMSSLDHELQQIKETAEKEAWDEYQRLLTVAEQDAAKTLERARREIEGMTRAAQIELKEHAASLSIQLATEKIRSEMTDEDRSRLLERFVAKVGGRG